MRKTFFKIFLIITSILVMLSITACTNPNDDDDDETYVVAISIATETIPTDAIAGQVELSDIIINVRMSDNEIVEVPLTEERIFISDRGKLNRSGSHQISVIYGGMNTKFWLTLEEAPIINYTLYIINGTYQGQDPIEGNWEGNFPAGQRVTIEALDRSEEGLFFESWTISGQVYNRNATCEIDIDRDITIRANYALYQFRVTFDPDGGENIAQKETRLIETCPITTKENYVFVGWIEVDGPTGFVTFPYTVTDNVQLKAVWESLGLEYEKRIGDTGYTITGYNYTGSRTTLQIPDEYNGDEGQHAVIRIARDAFKDATTLESISIPQDLMYIEDYAFSECVNLTNIEVHENNAYYRDENGVLFDTINDNLLAYPAGRMLVNYDVDNVSGIAAGAFQNANVGSINIKSTIYNLGDNAFNSRTIDNVVFHNIISEELGYISEEEGYVKNLFSNNIRNIFVVQNAHLDGYKNNGAFKPYASKIEERIDTPSIDIYENLLYRLVTRELNGIPQSTIEIIGARRNIESLIIPTIPIDGKHVTSIGAYAFSYCYNLKTIDFPQHMRVDRIMEGAFDNTAWQKDENNTDIQWRQEEDKKIAELIIINRQLFRALEDQEEYTIPYYVSRICESSFSNLSRLRTVTFAVDGTGSRTITRIDARAFQNCQDLRNITIPGTVNILGESAFENTDLYNFSIEDNSNLTTIGDFCFRNAAMLTSIDLGVNVEDIGEGIFNNCYSLEEILVDGDRNGGGPDLEGEIKTYFVAKDGVLYEYNRNLVGDTDKFGQILHTYPAGRLDSVYELPDGVTHIREYAFYYSNIAAIVLSPTIHSIVERSIVVPHLVYLEFTNDINNVPVYSTLFPQFGPDYVVISEDAQITEYSTWWPSGNIKEKSEYELLNITIGIFDTNEGQNYLYRKDSEGLYILGAERTKEELDIPAEIEIDGSNYDLFGIEEYAFMGKILKSISLPDTLQIIKGYAFYHSTQINKITTNSVAPPILEYTDPEDEQTVISFNPNTIIENALIYVPTNPSGLEGDYAGAWPTTIDFILQIGAQLEIEFDAQGGSEPLLINPETGEPYDLSALETIPASPFTEREGYIFDGWYDNTEGSGEEVTFPYTKFKKITLYAKWIVRSFEINYQLGGGEFEEEDIEYAIPNDGPEPTTLYFIASVFKYFIPYENQDALPVPIKPGYDFKGWADSNGILYTNGQGELDNKWTTVIDNFILIAKWIEKEIEVTLDYGYEGAENSTTDITYLSQFNLGIPSRTGYTFLRWEDEEGNILTNSDGEGINNWTYTEEVTVIAKWQALTYTVSFDDGQGTAIQSVIITYDQESYEFVVPQKVDSKFFGWYDGEDGTGTQYTDENGFGIRNWDIANNVTLYAQWPVDVATLADLNSIKTNLEGSFILTNDITIVGEWVPIGIDDNSPFTGILDGNGHSIYNMTITDINLSYVGLIGYNQGIVRNLNLGINQQKTDTTNRVVIDIEDDLEINDLYVGGLIGYNGIDGEVINCKVASEINTVVDYESNTLFVGGIVGYNEGLISGLIIEELIEYTYLITEINTALDEEYTEPANMYKGTLVGYHAEGATIDSCSYDKVITSEDIEYYPPYGNIDETEKGAYINTDVTVSAMDSWD